MPRKSSSNKSLRSRRSRIPRRYWVGLIAFVTVILAAGITFLLYRRTLERADPLSDRAVRTKPPTLSVTAIRLRVPRDDLTGFAWMRVEVKARQVDPSGLAREAITLWAERTVRVMGIEFESSVSPVEHVFLDKQGVVYIDFAPWFVSSLGLGTTGEMELHSSLEQTVRANVPEVRMLIVLSGGVALDTWNGHLGLPGADQS